MTRWWMRRRLVLLLRRDAGGQDEAGAQVASSLVTQGQAEDNTAVLQCRVHRSLLRTDTRVTPDRNCDVYSALHYVQCPQRTL